MTPDIFSEWLKRQGHKIIKTQSSFWYDQAPKVFQGFPYHWLIEPDEEELCRFLTTEKGVALRYSTPLSAPLGKLSYHVLCEGPSLELEPMPRRARQDIRKGLEYASIERIPISRLAIEGWDLRAETLARQGREKAENRDWWQRLCYAAEGLPGFDAWGAVHEGHLVSSLLAFVMDDCYTFLYHQSATDHLKHGINNALFYVVTTDALKRDGISQVFIALHSLDASNSVDKFKFRMGYVAKPLRQRVVFNPQISAIFNPLTYSALNSVRKFLPGNTTVAKAEGMVRFYLQGKHPLSEQEWPEVLLEQKDAIQAQVDKE